MLIRNSCTVCAAYVDTSDALSEDLVHRRVDAKGVAVYCSSGPSHFYYGEDNLVLRCRQSDVLKEDRRGAYVGRAASGHAKDLEVIVIDSSSLDAVLMDKMTIARVGSRNLA